MRVDVRDRVLLAVDRALLEGEVQLLERDLDRLGAHRGRVHEELRRRREAHAQALEVGGRSNRHVGRELAGAGVPAAEDVDAGLLLEALLQRRPTRRWRSTGTCARCRRTRRLRRPRSSARTRRSGPTRPGCPCRCRRRSPTGSGRRRGQAGWPPKISIVMPTSAASTSSRITLAPHSTWGWPSLVAVGQGELEPPRRREGADARRLARARAAALAAGRSASAAAGREHEERAQYEEQGSGVACS